MGLASLVVAVMSLIVTGYLAWLALDFSQRSAAEAKAHAMLSAKLVAAAWRSSIMAAHERLQALRTYLDTYDPMSDDDLYEICLEAVDEVAEFSPDTLALAGLAASFKDCSVGIGAAFGELAVMRLEILRMQRERPWLDQQHIEGTKYKQMWLPKVQFAVETLRLSLVDLSSAADLGKGYPDRPKIDPWLQPIRMSHHTRRRVAEMRAEAIAAAEEAANAPPQAAPAPPQES